MPAHGQKTRHLDRPPSWRRPWQVVVDPGTDNSTGRLKEKYTWFRDKYWLRCNEVAPVGAIIVTFDFKPVPKSTWKTIKSPIELWFVGYYTGNHATPSAPKLQIYDHLGTDWEDIAGGVLTTGASAEEFINVTIPQEDKYWEAGTNNVRIRIFHPNVAGNVTHELHINHLGLGVGSVTTTTSTTSTTSTTTTA